MDTRGGDLQNAGLLYLGTCHTGSGRNANSHRFMMFTQDERLMGLNFCCDSGYSETLQFHGCHGQGGAQAFKYDPLTKQIRQRSGKCVTGSEEMKVVIMSECRDGDRSQRWNFEYTYF